MNILDIVNSNRNIYIYGAKNVGREIYKILLRHGMKNFKSFVDKNQNIKNCITFDKLKFEFNSDHRPLIIIASRQYYDELKRELENAALLENIDFISAFPLLGPSFEIDLLTQCNLRCPSCPQANYPVRLPPGRMSIEYFTNVVDKILRECPTVSSISLFCWSEPFLRNDLPDFIKIVKERNIACYISTNFSHTQDIEEVVKAEPDYLRISISGYYQSTYSRDHTNGDAYLVYSNLFKLRYLLNKYNSDIYVDVAYHLYKYNNSDDLDRARMICNDLGFNFTPFAVLPLPVENMIAIQRGDKNLIQQISLEKFIKKFYVKIHPSKKLSLDDCSSKNIFPILPNGNVLACDFCYDVNRSKIADNFLDVSMADLIKRKKTNSVCNTCLQLGLPLLFNTIIDSKILTSIRQQYKELLYRNN